MLTTDTPLPLPLLSMILGSYIPLPYVPYMYRHDADDCLLWLKATKYTQTKATDRREKEPMSENDKKAEKEKVQPTEDRSFLPIPGGLAPRAVCGGILDLLVQDDVISLEEAAKASLNLPGPLPCTY